MDKPFLRCIGHRGVMGHEPENTLRSIRKALALGAPCVEIDVYWADGHLMVIHDDRLERTTNGTGLVMEQTFETLRSLDAGQGERIPTLEEVCETVKDKAGLNIELKGPGTAAPVANFVAQRHDDGWDKTALLVSSFSHRELIDMRQHDADVPLGVITQNLCPDDLDFAEKIGAFSIHPAYTSLTQPLIDQAHALNLRIYAYTVNATDDIARLAKLGIDGVFTNYPERVLNKCSQGEVPPYWVGC